MRGLLGRRTPANTKRHGTKGEKPSAQISQYERFAAAVCQPSICRFSNGNLGYLAGSTETTRSGIGA